MGYFRPGGVGPGSPGYAGGALDRDVARLRDTLRDDIPKGPAAPPSRPFLVVLSGLPGTGKSHFARELAQRLPFVTVGSDRTRKALVGQPKYSPEEHIRVFAACHRLIEECLEEGYRVIFDATNLTEKYRQPLYRVAERLGAPTELVGFTAPQRVIRRRLSQRASGRLPSGYSDADWEIYCRLRPGQEPIARPHLMVDSSKDISPVVEEILRRVEAARG